jgi:hypothetical protein
MNDSSLLVICAVISGPLGIVVGYVLNEWGTRRREAQAAMNQRQNIRMLLRLENDLRYSPMSRQLETPTRLKEREV